VHGFPFVHRFSVSYYSRELEESAAVNGPDREASTYLGTLSWRPVLRSPYALFDVAKQEIDLVKDEKQDTEDAVVKLRRRNGPCCSADLAQPK